MTARIDSWIKSEITRKGFAALYFAGPTEVVFRGPGDNCGHRPIRTGIITAYADTMSKVLDWASWHCPQRVLFRTWCESWDSAKALEGFVLMSLPEGKLRKAYVSFPFDLDVRELEKAVHLLASDCGLKSWSDDSIIEHVKNLHRQKVKGLKREAYV